MMNLRALQQSHFSNRLLSRLFRRRHKYQLFLFWTGVIFFTACSNSNNNKTYGYKEKYFFHGIREIHLVNKFTDIFGIIISYKPFYPDE